MDGNAGIELEHAIGFSCGTSRNSLAYYPLEANKYISVQGGCAVLGDLTDPHDQLFYRGHTDDVSCIALSPSSKILVSGQNGDESDVIVWDLPMQKMAYRFSEHDGGVEQVAISHDDRLLVTIGTVADRKMVVWDLFTGKIVATVSAAPMPVSCVAWGGMVKDIKRRNTDKYQLITAGNRKMYFWSLDPYTGELVGEAINVGANVRDYTCMDFNEDFSLLFAGTSSGDVSVISVKHKTLYSTFNACHGGVGYLRCHGTNIIVGGGDASFSVWNLTQSIRGEVKIVEISAIRNIGGPICAISVSPDGSEALAGTVNGIVSRIRLGNMKSLTRVELPSSIVSENHCDAATYIAYTQESSERFATCSKDKTICIWDVNDYSIKTKVQLGTSASLAPLNLAFSPDGLYTGWNDGKVRCHSIDTGEELWTIKDAHRGEVSSMQLSHNERFIISGGTEGEVRVWELRSRELVTHLKEHTGRVNEIVLFDDDVHALSCSRDRSILCWDLRREKRISSHSQRMGGISSIALSRDQTQVLSVGQEKKITFWDLRVPNPVQFIDPAHQGEARCITVSNGGNLFATGGVDKTVKLWDMRSAGLVSDGIGHSGAVNCVRFAPDDKQMTSVGDDGGVFVWNVFS